MEPHEHIAAAERELGLEDGYPYDPNDEPDAGLAAAHALIAIAKLLAAR